MLNIVVRVIFFWIHLCYSFSQNPPKLSTSCGLKGPPWSDPTSFWALPPSSPFSSHHPRLVFLQTSWTKVCLRAFEIALLSIWNGFSHMYLCISHRYLRIYKIPGIFITEVILKYPTGNNNSFLPTQHFLLSLLYFSAKRLSLPESFIFSLLFFPFFLQQECKLHKDGNWVCSLLHSQGLSHKIFALKNPCWMGEWLNKFRAVQRWNGLPWETVDLITEGFPIFADRYEMDLRITGVGLN